MSLQFWPGLKRQNRNVILASKEGLNCAWIISSSTASTGWDVGLQVELVGLSQGQKSKMFMQSSLPFIQDPDYPANNFLLAGLIRQISCYLLD